MKEIRCFLLLVTTFFLASLVKAGVRDSTRYYFSLEVMGANPFYDMPNVEYLYKYQQGGFTRGLLLRWNMGRGFYTGVGCMYSSSLFKADTTGAFLLQLEGIERRIAYWDRMLLFGKDFTIIRNRLTLGAYAGTLKGNMEKGKQYKDDVMSYGPPVVVLYRAASYTHHPFAIMLGARIGYKLSKRMSLNAYGFKRWFDPIDYTTMDNKRGVGGYVYRRWYFGFGLQYQVLHKPRVDSFVKGVKNKTKQH